MEKDIHIALDGMGGDRGSLTVLKGAFYALKRSSRLYLTVIGQREELIENLRRLGEEESPRLTIMNATEVIEMTDQATTATRQKKDSSIHVGLKMLKDNYVHGFVSAGHSGAIMTAALTILGRISGVERPAIMVKIPNIKGSTILMDAGANTDCRPNHLFQFAEMATLYSQKIDGIDKPRVGIISNGSEAHKGTDLTREAAQVLEKEEDMNYTGYIEGYDILSGKVDIAICDGFVGNVVLKTIEGISKTLGNWFKEEIKKSLLHRFGTAFLSPVIKNFKSTFSYETYGAAPLLGINGLVMISHGSSNEVAIGNGILMAVKAVDQTLVEVVSQKILSIKERANQS